MPSQGCCAQHPSLSVDLEDFPPLSGPTHSWGSMASRTIPQRDLTPRPACSSALASPKAQKQSHSRDTSSSGRAAAPTPTYAQAVSSPVPSHTGAPAAQAFSPSQALAWCEPWETPMGPNIQANMPPPCCLCYYPPSHRHLQEAVGPHHQIPPSWQAYLQTILTKEDFKQLIEDVKSTSCAEIKTLHANFEHQADYHRTVPSVTFTHRPGLQLDETHGSPY